jgi:tRNA-dihydrouridine synthase
MHNFWSELPKPFTILAPMEAVTDVVFRHVVAQAGAPDVWFSEFTNATGWVHAGDKAIGGRLIKTDDEHPIVAQLWGSDPAAMEKMALYCAELDYDGIDLNMGCPDKSAVKSGGGAGMILTPDLAVEMIHAARRSGLPVSVKTRLGYSHIDEWHDWIGRILAEKPVNFTIHLRTRKEMSKVPAHYELIDDIVRLRDEIAPETLLTINGDIENREHGLELVTQHPGVDGVMIGRGIFHDPFAFARSDRVAGDNADQILKPAQDDMRGELLNLLCLHLDLYDQYAAQTGRPYETLKRFYKIYVKEFDGASEVRDKLMHTKSTSEARAVINTL